MISPPRLRRLSAASAILLLAQLGLASLPAHADEPGPGSPETSTWVTTSHWDVELGDTVTLQAGSTSWDGPVPDGGIAFLAGTDTEAVQQNDGTASLLTPAEGITVNEDGMADFSFTFSDEWFAEHTDGRIVPSEIQSLEIAAAYVPAAGSALLPSVSSPLPVNVSSGGPGFPGDGGPGFPGDGGPGFPGDGGPGFPGDGPGDGSGVPEAAVTMLSASSATVKPGGDVTFTVQVADSNGPRTAGTLSLLANSDAGSVFNCAVICSTLLTHTAPDPNGSASFTVTLDDATFAAKGSSIRPSSGEPVYFGVNYSFGGGIDAAQGKGNIVSVRVHDGPTEPVVVPPRATTTVLSIDKATPAYGDPVTFTARVTSGDSPVTTGAVALHAGGAPFTPAQGLPLDATGTATFTAPWDAAWFAANASGDVRPAVNVPLSVSAAYLPAEVPAGDTTFAPSVSGATPVTPRAIETAMTLAHTSGSLEHGATATFTATLPSDAKGTLSVTCPDGTCVASRAVTGTSTFEVQLKNNTPAEAARTVTASFSSDNPRYSDASASTTISVKNAPVKLAFLPGAAGESPSIAISAASVPSSITVRIIPSLGTPVTASYAVDPATSIAKISYSFVGSLPYTIEASLGGATGTWSYALPSQPLPSPQMPRLYLPGMYAGTERPIDTFHVTAAVPVPPAPEFNQPVHFRLDVELARAGDAELFSFASVIQGRLDAYAQVLLERRDTFLRPRSSAATLLSTGAAKSALTSAATVTTKGTCEVKKTALSCDFGYIPAGAQVTYTIDVPVAAGAAGKTLSATTTATATNPFTGEVTVLSKTVTKHKVAKRTAFTGSLKATKKSVKRGKKATVTAKLTNAGVIAATAVSSCVTTPKGVKISKAKGAKISKAKTKACWTVKSLKAKKSNSFKVTFTAPKKKGTTTVTWTVKPKKSQADGFTLKQAVKVA